MFGGGGVIGSLPFCHSSSHRIGFNSAKKINFVYNKVFIVLQRRGCRHGEASLKRFS